jgi:peptidoglycan L-alanyl-D-glutamate endopeptidase CwlK
MTTFDPRTETNIKTLLPAAQEKAREFMAACLAAGITLKIIGGTRTYDEQNALYEQGRTTSGSIVTNARGGYSWHNFGIAWDIGIFVDSKYLDESPLYAKAGAIGKSLGLEWGGDWTTIQDEPHFQLKLGMTLAECRERVANGQSIA